MVREDMAELALDIDHAKAGALGVSVADINDTLSTAWGGTYGNDFIDRSRIKKVHVQATADARMTPGISVRTQRQGRWSSSRPAASAHWTYGSPRLERFNAGRPWRYSRPGGTGPLAWRGEGGREIAAKLPAGIGYDWSGTSYEERKSGPGGAGAVRTVDSRRLPVSRGALRELVGTLRVMLVVPLGVLGAIVALTGRGLSNDIYFQVGLLATIGLSSKNAILIVEFAKEQMAGGKELVAATLEGCACACVASDSHDLAGLGLWVPPPLALPPPAPVRAAKERDRAPRRARRHHLRHGVSSIFFVPLFAWSSNASFGRRKPEASAAPTLEAKQ
ncbi:MAG: efflux RND transporter permease subunit [Rhodocyclaceae bacterium]